MERAWARVTDRWTQGWNRDRSEPSTSAMNDRQRPTSIGAGPDVPQASKDQTLWMMMRQALFTIASGGIPVPQDVHEAFALGADPNATTDAGEPLLHWLTRQSLDLLSYPKTQTLPLLVRLLNALLSAGANPNGLDQHGRSALQLTSEPAVVDVLALAGARLGPNPDVARVWREELGQACATTLVATWHTAHRTYEERVLREALPKAADRPSLADRPRLRL